MPNFPPLRRYVLSVVDRWIDQYGLVPPFLDVGCGTGAVASHLAAKGWHGLALDSSSQAVEQARAALAGYPEVRVSTEGVDQLAPGQFQTVLIMDVLEHVRDDEGLLQTLARCLAPGGAMILLTPVNPREWRQDDVLYGHFRRYEWNDLERKLAVAGLAVQERWNVTVPFMWALRRVYLKLLPRRAPGAAQDTLTAASSFYNPWNENPWLKAASTLFGLSWWWAPLFWVQNAFAGSRGGHAAMFLALKIQP